MKKILYLGLWCFVIALSIAVLYTRYVFSDLNQSIDKEAVKLVIKEIQSTKGYDEFVYSTYNQVYDNALERSSFEHLISNLLGDRKECPCYYATHWASPYILKSGYKWHENRYAAARYLEKEVSQKECLNFILTEFDYRNNNIGIEAAAKFYYQKNIADLEKEELIGLFVMYENPTFYNPKRFPERHAKRVAELMQKIQ